MTVRRARPNLGPIGWQPRNLEAGIETGFRQHFPEQQYTLAAETRHPNTKIQVFRRALDCRRIAFRQTLFMNAKEMRNIFERRSSRSQWPWHCLLGPIAKHCQRKCLFHNIVDPALRLNGRHLPNRRARRQHFDERESQAANLVLDGALDGAFGLGNLLVISKAHALDIDRRLQGGQQFADMQRIPFCGGAAPARRGGALLSQQSGRRSLSAGHAVDSVVHEDHRDVFAAIGRMQNFRGPDSGQVPVALVANYYALRPAALHRRGYGRRATMSGRYIADVEVVVSENRAADRADENWLGLDA